MANNATKTTINSTSHTERLNNILRTMHGATTCLGTSISQLVPFPTCVTAPADARVIDLSIRLDPDCVRDRANTTVRVRLATGMTRGETVGLFQCQFDRLGLAATSRVSESESRISTILSDDALTHYAVCVSPAPNGSIASLEVTSETSEDQRVCPDLWTWHGWQLPSSGAQLENVEVFSIATGPHSDPRAVYDSHYRFPGVARGALRRMIDRSINTNGWRYVENYEDILELDTPFDAEICIDGEGDSSTLSILGEFALRL